MPTARTYLALPVAVGLGVLLTVAGCGSKTPTISSGGAPAGSGSTVSVSNVGGQSVLVDQSGVALGMGRDRTQRCPGRERRRLPPGAVGEDAADQSHAFWLPSRHGVSSALMTAASAMAWRTCS